MRLLPLTPFSFSETTSRLRPRLFATASVPAPRSPRPSYFVPRNSRGSLPVYSDIRNGRTRFLITIRNVDGSIKALVDDLLHDLSDSTSPIRTVIKPRITGSNHLVLSGLSRKQVVLDWLVRRGF